MQGASKWWPGRVLACFARRARLNKALGFQHGRHQCQQVLTQPNKHEGNLGANSTRCQHCVNMLPACCAVAEGRPAWALAAARLRAVAEGHQGHGAAGMPRPHAGRRAFWRTATGATLSVGVSKWWPGRVLACFAGRARLNMALGFQHGQQ